MALVVLENKGEGNVRFSADFRRLLFVQVLGPLTVEVRCGGELILQEAYSPDADKCVEVRDMRRVVDDAFVFPNIGVDECVTLKPLELSYMCYDSEGPDPEWSEKAYYSRSRMNVTPDLCRVWLSWYTDAVTRPGRLEYAAFLKHAGTLVRVGVAYTEDGRDRWKVVDWEFTADDGDVVALSVGVDAVAEKCGVAVESIVFYKLFLVNGGDEDVITVNVARSAVRNETLLYYLNSWGMPECFACEGLTDEAPELEGDVLEAVDHRTRSDSWAEEVNTVSTGWMGDAKRLSLKSLLSSPMVWLRRDDGSFVEIVVTDAELERTVPSNEVAGAKVTYKLAERRVSVFDRMPEGGDEGIFDKTFDYTFD